MTRKWSNLNLPGALHFVTAVDHEWWWSDDGEKLSAAMKKLGWYSYHKRKRESGGRRPFLTVRFPQLCDLTGVMLWNR